MFPVAAAKCLAFSTMDMTQPPASLTYTLIVKEPWFDLILSGKKTIELRNAAYHKELIKKQIGISRSHTSQVFGHVTLVDIKECVPAAKVWSDKWRKLHCITKAQQTLWAGASAPKFAAYVLADPVIYPQPLKFKPTIGGEIMFKPLIDNACFQKSIADAHCNGLLAAQPAPQPAGEKSAADKVRELVGKGFGGTELFKEAAKVGVKRRLVSAIAPKAYFPAKKKGFAIQLKASMEEEGKSIDEIKQALKAASYTDGMICGLCGKVGRPKAYNLVQTLKDQGKSVAEIRREMRIQKFSPATIGKYAPHTA